MTSKDPIKVATQAITRITMLGVRQVTVGNTTNSSLPTDMHMPVMEEYLSYKIMRSMALYLGPMMMVFGTIGNVLAGVVIVKSPKLWGCTTSIYILTLAIVDTATLNFGLTDFILRMKGVEYFSVSDFSCKMVTYCLYLFPMTEGWVLVQISLERFTAVYFPLSQTNLF